MSHEQMIERDQTPGQTQPIVPRLLDRPLTYILDDHGNPVEEPDIATWGLWFQDHEEARRVAADDVGEVRVSTVFLGMDHSHFGAVPLLYETMIFGGENDMWQDRYATREEALAGHAEAVKLVKA